MHSGGDYMLHWVCKFHKHILYRNFDLTLDNWLTFDPKGYKYLISESDWQLISLYNITPVSHIKVTRIRENDHQKKETLDFKTNSPCQ